MRNLILLLLALCGCVSLPTYRSAETKRDSILLVNKTLRKELDALKKEQQRLLDSLQVLRQSHHGNLTSIQNRLQSPTRPALLASHLSLRDPAEMEFNYQAYRSSHNFKDTQTAQGIKWMTEPEKLTLYWLNVARLDPKGFCRRFVLPAHRLDSGNAYLASLVDYMMHMQPRNALMPDPVQYKQAACHARSSGMRGYVGHRRQTPECKLSYLGECCSYGTADPLGIVLQLLIDEDVPSLGHRYICLGRYETVGIATAPHTRYGNNTVLDFR